MKQGLLWKQNWNCNGLGMAFPTEPASLHSSEIQARPSKMNALHRLLTANSVANSVSKMQRNMRIISECGSVEAPET